MLTVGQKIIKIGNTSFEIESVIFNEESQAVCRSVVVAVCFDFDIQKPVKVYSSIKNDFNR